MKVDEIIKQVRLCIDEESNNSSYITDEKDDLYMDNIIKAKIPFAVNWLSVSAPAQNLVIPNNSSDGMIKDYTTSGSAADGLQYTKEWDKSNGIGCITFPNDNPVRLLRVRGNDWHKAICHPYEEDADESLYMYDETVKGTPDRPMAVIVTGNPTRLLIQPNSDTVSLSFARSISLDENASSNTDIPIPDSLKSPFIYYIAFLLLSAYEDSKANMMYTIALQQLGVNQTSK